MSIDSVSGEEGALFAAWRLQRTGNFVAAFDLAQDAWRRWPESRPLAHLAILALASCGSTEAALAAFRATSLGADVNENFPSLEARLLKDLAFNGRTHAAAMLGRAAEAYERIAQRTGGTYSRQNAALLWMLAGDDARALRLAASVAAEVTEFNVPNDAEAAYFHWATLAEAALVLGDQSLLQRAVAGANPLCRQNSWARSRTFLQMRRLSGVRPECAPLVEEWYRPPVGLVLDSRWLPEGLGSRIGVDLDDMPALAYGIGSDPAGDRDGLAGRGVQLHVIHADSPAAMPGIAVAAVPSTRAASGHCDSHTWSSLLLDEGDDHDRVCAETALGLSVGHAAALRAPWVVLAKAEGRWHAVRDADRGAIRAAIASGGNPRSDRARYAFLFADAVSYSSLSAADTRRYWTCLLPQTAAAVLRRHAATIVLRKTWGDAVHAVFRTATAAASAALDMQAATAQLVEELERGRRLSFRLAVHYGAADQGFDPVEEAPAIFGPQLSFAARIVPVAPPGGIFVTEPFAAQLSLEGGDTMHCSYVGTTSLAKTYGRVRLLALS